MKKLTVLVFAIILGLPVALLQGQNKDKVTFITPEPGFYQNSILRDDREVKEKTEASEPRRILTMDMSGRDLPNQVELYEQEWHTAPISQGNTGTCWCFSTISFLESEAYRLHNMEVKLSEMFTVYWEYVEKARRYVRERGNSRFSEGSEANAVTRMWKKYGCVPAEAYTGLLDGRKYHNHEAMVDEMSTFLASLKKTQNWNEEAALETIRAIMNHYAGIDVSLESSSVCFVDDTGKVIAETNVASEPEALVARFRARPEVMRRIGLAAGPLSQRLFAAMYGAGLPTTFGRLSRQCAQISVCRSPRLPRQGGAWRRAPPGASAWSPPRDQAS